MNKSSIIFGLGGLLVGSLGTSLYYRSTASIAPSAVVAPASSKKELPAADSGKSSAKSEDTAVAKQSSSPEIKKTEAVNQLASDHMEEIKKQINNQSAQRKLLKLNERLAGLKKQLGLTDAQAEELRPLVARMMASNSAFDLSEMISSGGGTTVISAESINEKKAKIAADKVAAENELLTKLSPEQQQAFAQWKLAEQANKVELATNRELSQLQSQMSLTPEQKDQAFAALSTLAQNESTEEGDLDPTKFMERRKSRLEALKPILTPEQMALYERNPGNVVTLDADSIMLDGADIGVGGTIQTQVITSPATISIGTDAPAGK